MDRLAKLQQDLQEKYEQTNNRVLELRERLSRLWECLDEDLIYRENFLQAHPGCHPHAESSIKEEIKRCEQIKKQKIQVFVSSIRTKIKLMWDTLIYSTEQREEFIHYYQDIFTEDILTLHEFYLEKLTKFYNEHKNIFDLVDTRKNLWAKMTELEARASEPGRYHNRGGQLLKEEKERKAIASNLPKIEEQIRELVNSYEASTGQVFTVNGKPLLQLMTDEWENRKAERHNKLSARKQALTPSTQQLFRSMATSPVGKRNRTAAGLPATADKNRPPTKRQLITGSATRAVPALTNNLSALKRTAVSTVKRRVSGRHAARLADVQSGHVKRKLDYNGDIKKTAKVNGSILKYKRRANGRRSGGRQSMNTTTSTAGSQEDQPKPNPLLESTNLTTYTDFKENIDENKISRSSMMRGQDQNVPVIVIEHLDMNLVQKKTPLKRPAPMTPKTGKENVQHLKILNTPKNGNLCTPTRLTRSALKLNYEGFATPRAPLSGTKGNVQRQNTIAAMSPRTTPNTINRSKSQLNFMITAKVPYIM